MTKIVDTAAVTEMTSTELREFAKTIGVKRAANDTKATLTQKVLATMKAKQAEREEIAAMKAKAKIRTKVETAARAPKTTDTLRFDRTGKAKQCTAQPCTRKVTENDMCGPHNEEGLWENTHSDENHAANVEAMGPSASAKLTEGCWICHPELNEAEMEEGTIFIKPTRQSKAGMVILAKGTYHHKSQLVRKAIEEAGGTVTKLQTTKGGVTVLKAQYGEISITAAWDGDAFDYASAAWGDRKYRNVKELVRLLAQA